MACIKLPFMEFLTFLGRDLLFKIMHVRDKDKTT